MSSRYALTCAADMTDKDRQDRRKREKQNPGKCFYRGGTTIGAGTRQCRWLRQVLVSASR
ncbi:hypothetical protein ACNKHT_12355 [Shigella flexneri]